MGVSERHQFSNIIEGVFAWLIEARDMSPYYIHKTIMQMMFKSNCDQAMKAEKHAAAVKNTPNFLTPVAENLLAQETIYLRADAEARRLTTLSLMTCAATWQRSNISATTCRPERPST